MTPLSVAKSNQIMSLERFSVRTVTVAPVSYGAVKKSPRRRDPFWWRDDRKLTRHARQSRLRSLRHFHETGIARRTATDFCFTRRFRGERRSRVSRRVDAFRRQVASARTPYPRVSPNRLAAARVSSDCRNILSRAQVARRAINETLVVFVVATAAAA